MWSYKILFIASFIFLSSCVQADDDSIIVFLRYTNAESIWNLWSIDDNGKNLNRLTNSSIDIVNLYSINASEIAYLNINKELYVYDFNDSSKYLLHSFKDIRRKSYEFNSVTLTIDKGKNKLAVLWQHDTHNRSIKIFDLITKKWSPIANFNTRVWTFYFSKDGNNILYLANDSIGKVNLKNGQTKNLLSLSEKVLDFYISQDTKIIAANVFNSERQQSEISIFKNKKLIDSITSNLSVSDPFISDDSKSLLYIDDYGLENNKLVLYSIDKKIKNVLLEGKGAIARPIKVNRSETLMN